MQRLTRRVATGAVLCHTLEEMLLLLLCSLFLSHDDMAAIVASLASASVENTSFEARFFLEGSLGGTPYLLSP